MKIKNLFILILTLSSHLLSADVSQNKPNVGLCIMATGRYSQFVEPLLASARKNFCTNSNVTYFIFTDGQIPVAPDVVRIEQKRLGWPYDTMMRMDVYAKHRDAYKNIDYLFATDADMRFVNTVGEEILHDLVGTQHPGFLNKMGSYETNKKSKAFVKLKNAKLYYAGGFWGGKTNEVLKMCDEITRRIRIDLKKKIIAVWHDESHLNRYFIDHPPTNTLSVSYCYPESWNLPYIKRLVALDKNHSELRK